MSVGTLNVATACSVGNVTKGLGEIRTELSKLPGAANAAGGSFSSLQTVLGRFGVAATGMGIAGAMMHNVARSIQEISQTGDVAAKIGILTERLGGLRYAAERTGSSAGMLDSGLAKMSRGISDSMSGTGRAGEAIATLGLNLQYVNSLTPDEQFRAIADAMDGVASPAERMSIAVKLFGGANADLVNTLSLGSAGLDEMQRKAEAMGVALDYAAVTRVKEAEEAVGSMGTAWQGAGNQIAVFTSGFLTLVGDAVGGEKGLLTGLNQIMGVTQEMNQHLRDNLEWQAKQQKLEAGLKAKAEAEQKVTDEYEKQLRLLKEKTAIEIDPQKAQFDKDVKQFGEGRAGNLLNERDKAEGIAYQKEKAKKAEEEAAQKKKEEDRKKEQLAREAERKHLANVRRDTEALQKLRDRVKDFGKTDLQKDESELMRTLDDPKQRAEAAAEFKKLTEFQQGKDDLDQLREDRKRMAGRGDDKMLDARSAEGWAALRSSSKDLMLVKADQQIKLQEQILKALQDGGTEEVFNF